MGWNLEVRPEMPQRNTIEKKSSEMNQQELEYFYSLKTIRGGDISEGEMHEILENAKEKYFITFLFLSEGQRVLSVNTFRNSYLRNNLAKFNEEELYFIYEGIRNQIRQNFDDFYFLFHHFLIHKDHKAFQNLVISLFANSSYKLDEIIVSNDLLTVFLRDSQTPSVFQLSILKAILESESSVIREYVKRLNLQLNFSGITGCKSYFKSWYTRFSFRPLSITFSS